jgi:sec-independent protein translocase protein TatC
VKPTLRLRRTPRNPNAEMPILEHLAELRSRLVKSMLALVAATTVAWFVLYEPAVRVVTRLYCEGVPESARGAFQAGGECKLAILSPIDPLNIRIRASLVLGLVIALPIIAFQIWRFIAPGLKSKEKRYAIPFALATTLLFALGVAMAAFTMPKAINFLTTIGGDQLATFLQADRYLRFVLFMGLAFGVAFEFPLVLVFLSMAGVLSSRAMFRAWRPAIAVIVAAAAVITPSGDPISLFAMAIPMCVFYFGAAGVARLVIEPARERRRARELTELEG